MERDGRKGKAAGMDHLRPRRSQVMKFDWKLTTVVYAHTSLPVSEVAQVSGRVCLCAVFPHHWIAGRVATRMRTPSNNTEPRHGPHVQDITRVAAHHRAKIMANRFVITMS